MHSNFIWGLKPHCSQTRPFLVHAIIAARTQDFYGFVHELARKTANLLDISLGPNPKGPSTQIVRLLPVAPIFGYLDPEGKLQTLHVAIGL